MVLCLTYAFSGEKQIKECAGALKYEGLICHPDLMNGIGGLGFKGQEGNSQDKKSRCLKHSDLFAVPYIDKSLRLKVISDNNSLSLFF